MKHLKMLGLAAVAAMAMMAVLGAGSASASVLCKTNASPCPEHYPAGTNISASLVKGTHATLTGGFFGDVTCTASTVTGKTSTTGGASSNVTGSVTGLTFTGCTHNGEKCSSVTAVNLPYHAEITASGKGNGALTVKSSGKGNPGAQVSCPGVACTFTTASASLGVTGGAPAIAKANGISLSREGGLCPSTANWDAEYTVSPSPLFII
jgi:hypothetical protein